MLLKHLSASNAKNYGLIIQAEAVINNAHTLYMIVGGPDRKSVERFMQPFAQAGTVEIFAASPCEEVVARGGCDTPG
ncbi:MAG TPA: sulfite oxidase [bacterium]|nr:sulfite oxidase [bacterium]